MCVSKLRSYTVNCKNKLQHYKELPFFFLIINVALPNLRRVIMTHYASSTRDSPSVVSMRLAAFDAVSVRVLNEPDNLREPEKREIKKK